MSNYAVIYKTDDSWGSSLSCPAIKFLLSNYVVCLFVSGNLVVSGFLSGAWVAAVICMYSLFPLVSLGSGEMKFEKLL